MSRPAEDNRGRGPPAVEQRAAWECAEAPKGTLHSALLLSANALPLPRASSFAVYEGDWRSSLVQGEDATAVWASSNHQDAAGDGGGYACEYMLAAFDPSQRKVRLIQAPVHVVQPLLKTHAQARGPPLPGEGSGAARRADLGIAFGSKKAQRGIRAADRNQLDVNTSDMQSYQSLLQASLAQELDGSPSEPSGPVHPNAAGSVLLANLEATTPADVYPIDQLVPAEVLAAIALSPYQSRSSSEEQLRQLPFRNASFVNERLPGCLLSKPFGRSSKLRLRLLVYLSYLFVVAREQDLGSLKRKLGDHCPDVIKDHLLGRFSEGGRIADGQTITSASRANAVANLLAVALHVDGFSLELQALTTDLRMEARSLSVVFKSLGCQIVYPQANTGSNSPVKGKLGQARAVLQLPLAFPQPRRKRKRG